MITPEPTLAMAWLSGGDIMIYGEDAPERISTQRAAQLMTFYEDRLRNRAGLGVMASDYLKRWVVDLERALTAQREWVLCGSSDRRAA